MESQINCKNGSSHPDGIVVYSTKLSEIAGKKEHLCPLIDGTASSTQPISHCKCSSLCLNP